MPLQETFKSSKAGMTQSLVEVTALFPGSWCTQGFVCTPQASLEGLRFDSKCNCAPPAVFLGFSFALGCRYLFLVGSDILLSMVIQQLVEILVFSQEKMSAPPSALPS